MNILPNTDWEQLWQQKKAHFKATIYDNPYIPEVPFLNQIKFLIYPSEEILYGGSAGGGKSSALLMSALQYVTEPDYSALLLRRTYPDLTQPGAILDRAKTWLSPFLRTGEVHYNNTIKTFTFPSGATLSFGYLKHDNDLDQYQGSELQFVGFDELTQFTERQYTYLQSRLRKSKKSNIPLRIRAGSNPGGRSHEFVKKRFVTGDVPFVPSSFKENKYLNIEEYSRFLDKLDEVTRLQLKFGDWDAELSEGLLVNRDQLNHQLINPTSYQNDWLHNYCTIGVDPASTGDDHFSMCCLVQFMNNNYVIVDLDSTPSSTPEELLKQFIERNSNWQPSVINFEKEPGASPEYALKYWRNILQPLIDKYGFRLTDTPATKTGSKYARAMPHAQLVREGRLFFNKALLDISHDGYNPLQNLFNQYIYVHPDKQVMNNHPSPDELDSVGYAYVAQSNIISDVVGTSSGRERVRL